MTPPETEITQQKMLIRPTAIAGSFYPANAAELDAMLDKFMLADLPAVDHAKAFIVPHAGYIYSGPVAAMVYGNLFKKRNSVKQVILLGPAHRVYVDGVALPSHSHFSTPLGNIPLNLNLLNKLQCLPFANINDAAHAEEHSLEIHLPFLQKTLVDFQLTPVVVGRTKPEQIAALLEMLWGGDETLVIISSDLSHFHDYDKACAIDASTTKLIESYAYEQIGPEQACGCMPVNGLLKLAKQKNMSIQTLDVRNSGDTAGNKQRVVGYGSFALFENRILNAENETLVFDLMRNSIELGLEHRPPTKPQASNYSPPLNKPYAVFVTLTLNGKLRGCIGSTEAHMPLINAVTHYAHAAAFSDPRFPKLTPDEYKQVDISLSILTPPSEMTFKDEGDLLSQLQPNKDGLIIQSGQRRATFLPVVWESLSKPSRFLAELKHKASIGKDEAPEKAWRYFAEYYA